MYCCKLHEKAIPSEEKKDNLYHLHFGDKEVQKQTDGYNWGPFTLAFAAEILDGKSPV